MTDINSKLSLPVIDISSLRQFISSSSEEAEKDISHVIQQIGDACQTYGFFYISNHGVNGELIDQLMSQGRQFFGKSMEYKNKFHMKNSRVYRGYFHVGEELTYGRKGM
jgi:isopenicillin N synthase-like dioxygenase